MSKRRKNNNNSNKKSTNCFGVLKSTLTVTLTRKSRELHSMKSTSDYGETINDRGEQNEKWRQQKKKKKKQEEL